jgi:hypothetical protein
VGGGSLLDIQPGLLEALDELVYPETRGNPMSMLRWTSKSSTKLPAGGALGAARHESSGAYRAAARTERARPRI